MLNLRPLRLELGTDDDGQSRGSESVRAHPVRPAAGPVGDKQTDRRPARRVIVLTYTLRDSSAVDGGR
jgi:hypothetical protein